MITTGSSAGVDLALRHFILDCAPDLVQPVAVIYREHSVTFGVDKANEVLLADSQSYSTVLSGRRGSEADLIGVTVTALCLVEGDDVEEVCGVIASYIPIVIKRRENDMR